MLNSRLYFLLAVLVINAIQLKMAHNLHAKNLESAQSR